MWIIQRTALGNIYFLFNFPLFRRQTITFLLHGWAPCEEKYLIFLIVNVFLTAVYIYCSKKTTTTIAFVLKPTSYQLCSQVDYSFRKCCRFALSWLAIIYTPDRSSGLNRTQSDNEACTVSPQSMVKSCPVERVPVSTLPPPPPLPSPPSTPSPSSPHTGASSLSGVEAMIKWFSPAAGEPNWCLFLPSVS